MGALDPKQLTKKAEKKEGATQLNTKGQMEFLNLMASSWYYVIGGKKHYVNVLEAIQLNTKEAKGTKASFSMCGKSYDLTNMRVSFSGQTHQLVKCKLNVRKRPDDNEK